MPHHDVDMLEPVLAERPQLPMVGTCYACNPPHPLVGDPEEHVAGLAEVAEEDEEEGRTDG